MTSLLAAALTLSSLAAEPAAPERHAVMISIDGLMPGAYLDPEKLGIEAPNLRRLMTEGAYARGVVGVLPTVTYPSHTTLITGVTPGVHGIVNNTYFDPLDTSRGAWRWYAREIRVPTLVAAAKARWLRTASFAWPVGVGLGSDFNIPEFWRNGSQHDSDLELLRALSEPDHLLEDIEGHRGARFEYPLTDSDRIDAAVYTIETHRPHLTLIHIFDLDFVQHEKGPGSPEAIAAVEASDRELGRVLAAVEKAGIADRTLVAVVSDHGFLPVLRTLHPNSLLAEAGLIEVDADGRVTSWRAIFHEASGSALLRVADPADLAAVGEARALLATKLEDPTDGLRAILERDEIAVLGGATKAQLWLDAREGFYFSGRITGEWSEATDRRGTHGYAPTRPELHASLILAGPGFEKRGDLGIVPMTRIAPTLAAHLGIELSAQAGAPLDRVEVVQEAFAESRIGDASAAGLGVGFAHGRSPSRAVAVVGRGAPDRSRRADAPAAGAFVRDLVEPAARVRGDPPRARRFPALRLEGYRQLEPDVRHRDRHRRRDRRRSARGVGAGGHLWGDPG